MNIISCVPKEKQHDTSFFNNERRKRNLKKIATKKHLTKERPVLSKETGNIIVAIQF